MSVQSSMIALRRLAARRDGLRCAYCGVPTGATIEHVRPRAEGGSSWSQNLVLACPWCNRHKGTKDAEIFKAEGGWRLERPQDLPEDTLSMLKICFGWKDTFGLVATGCTGAKLEVKKGQVTILVRPDKHSPWFRYPLGDSSSSAVTQASWDFLTRHDTPFRSQRKKRRPPKKRRPTFL